MGNSSAPVAYRFALTKVYTRRTDTPRQSYIIWYNFDISFCVEEGLQRRKGARLLPYRFALKKIYKGEIVPRLLRIVLC